ncbi:conjugative transfer protein MobI(A/C) [Devosia sp.]|uniref:conjugative transfer protein MobI(A/C) n=1 Tax=Devosia sp. TaxID=1871048 RepID=UPI0027341F13|nr:conjugative transfer protein MobI(A/C) [Devosia sp.]MDP2779606.1 conjugative transfer protein MobI(A/C) [Devosia sp.]
MQTANGSGNVEIAIQSLRNHVEELGVKAMDLCQQHFNLVMAENKLKSWDEKSVLFVQTRMRGNSLTANWYEIGWYGSKTAMTRRMTKRLITRQKGDYGYNMAVLLKLAQPWEIEMIQTIEPELREIRREVTLTSKAIILLKHANKTE